MTEMKEMVETTEDTIVKLILLVNNQILITEIEEIGSELGEPDCKLVNPFLVIPNPIEGLAPILRPWMSECSKQSLFKIHSDKILTITEPKATLLEKYQELTK